MYELTIFLYLLSFLYIALIASSWRAGCIETSFWYSINGIFMFLLVVQLIPSPENYMIGFSAVNIVRASLLLILGRGKKEKTAGAQSVEDHQIIEEGVSHHGVKLHPTCDFDKVTHDFESKGVMVAARHAAKAGYTVEDVSDKRIGYHLRISKEKSLYYVLVKVKVEAEGMITINPREYEKASEFGDLFYLYTILGGVEPWDEEIHIICNPVKMLRLSFDRALQQYIVDSDKIRVVSRDHF